ncbi:uncharacterized protein MELLADRAFT_93073 [Melampsora larici-populina 98AG31]|uniref:SUN domain-containing protein n=1 Tax=Melampsora larici-populina (strain 98AG31 / pathotype 3-4-7) TaxID=747676 RepID=F4S3U4_MELLP|nr:uncharacterized protein MELLADRAFT_93073 [Melampsora larici-populina 98AG31]EGG00735.1 hypothetical protein MELLADRAFT_93073 [Melampsora larici-populina 98AG31]
MPQKLRPNNGDPHSFGRRAGFRVRAAVHELSRHTPAIHVVLLIFLSITICGRIHLLDHRLKKAKGELFYIRVHTTSQPCTSVWASSEGFQSKQRDAFNDPETVKIAESHHLSSIIPAFVESNSHHNDVASDDRLQDVHSEKDSFQAWPEDIIGDVEKGLQTTTLKDSYQVQTGLPTSYMAREAFKQCIKDRDGASITNSETPGTALSGDGTAGNCWAFRGSVGQLGIGLSSKIDITALSIEHIGAQLAQDDITSAPREFELWGVSDDEDTVAGTTPLFKGVYSISSPSSTLQMFELNKSHKLLFSKVLFKVISNYGNPVFTCLYRVRIHGQPIF